MVSTCVHCHVPNSCWNCLLLQLLGQPLRDDDTNASDQQERQQGQQQQQQQQQQQEQQQLRRTLSPRVSSSAADKVFEQLTAPGQKGVGQCALDGPLRPMSVPRAVLADAGTGVCVGCGLRCSVSQLVIVMQWQIGRPESKRPLAGCNIQCLLRRDSKTVHVRVV